MAGMQRRAGERLQSLERGLRVLGYLNRVGSAKSSQVARSLKLTRSTAHRMLSVLEDLGLLRSDAGSGHFHLAAGVLALSGGFRDELWISVTAEPLMREWSRIHHWPLLLVTPLNGVLTVRVSTDHESPISIDRFVPGSIMPIEGSTAGALLRAFSDLPEGVESPEAAPTDAVDLPAITTVRRRGYVASPTACYAGARISVPLLAQEHFLGVLTMRCVPDCLAPRRTLERWVVSLKTLGAQIIQGSESALGLATRRR